MKTLILTLIILYAINGFAKIGDDAGNGGFAYKQSIKLLEESSRELEIELLNVDHQMFLQFPERRQVLVSAINYDNIIKEPNLEVYRNGMLLMFDYEKITEQIKVYKPYYLSFASTADYEFDIKKVEVKKRLIHESSHLWGFEESESEVFAYQILALINNENPTPIPIQERRDITIRSVCACERGMGILANNCTQFCKNQTNPTPTMYLNAEIDPKDRTLGIKNIRDWCSMSLSDNPTPVCRAEFFDGIEKLESEVNFVDDNNMEIDLSNLAFLKTYVAQIKLLGGQNQTSNGYQIYLKRPEEESYRPVGITGVTKYFCENTNIGGINQHYYYLESEGFEPYQSDAVFCYDRTQYQAPDNYFYPRLGATENFLNVLDKNDEYLFDRNSNGVMDVNEIIKEILINHFNIYLNVNVLSALELIPSPDLPPRLLGYYLVPYADNNKKIICPNLSGDVTEDIPYLYALSKILPFKFEGFYLAQTINSSYKDNLLINETRLKAIGFSIVNGVLHPVNNELMYSRSIFFYWPLNLEDPYTQHNGQWLYKVIGMNKEEDDAKYLTDKKIGCLPKTNI